MLKVSSVLVFIKAVMLRSVEFEFELIHLLLCSFHSSCLLLSDQMQHMDMNNENKVKYGFRW